ncbi:MAG: hypothetical protein ACI977_000490 [Candidatus Nanohaloarchaea archaeon]|jgi:hypothetical protein
MKDWKVFQQDVLDLLRQYEGYFDFFERVGSLSDRSRPDSVARISREDKEEIWIVDAKNKDEVDEEDLERMNQYITSLKRKPLDVGLEESEISNYTFRPVFVLSGKSQVEMEADLVPFSAMHQFLQRELVYTDTSRAVREIAKMAERRQLSHGQVRLLVQSLKPYEERVETVTQELKKIEEDYSSLEVEKPFEDGELPVDTVIRHTPSGKRFFFDIPYSREELSDIEDRVEDISNMVESEVPVYYAAINTFEQVDSDFMIRQEELESEINETLGVLSVEQVAELFTPKVKCTKSYGDGFIEVRASDSDDFILRVSTKDDKKFIVEAVVGDDLADRIRDRELNSGNSFGNVEGNKFRHEFEVKEELEIEYSGKNRSFPSYKREISDFYHSVVSSFLGKKVKNKV